MARNMFIVSIENIGNTPPSAKGVQETLERAWGRSARIHVEEGGHKEVARLVSDYLDAEEALEKFTSENHITVGQDLNSPTGKKWMELYDKVREKRAILVSNLREYGCVV